MKMTMKEFCLTEAERTGVCESAIRSRIGAGRYAGMKLERINQRVVFVVERGEYSPGKGGRRPKTWKAK
jgi:hypothetical protein